MPHCARSIARIPTSIGSLIVDGDACRCGRDASGTDDSRSLASARPTRSERAISEAAAVDRSAGTGVGRLVCGPRSSRAARPARPGSGRATRAVGRIAGNESAAVEVALDALIQMRARPAVERSAAVSRTAARRRRSSSPAFATSDERGRRRSSSMSLRDERLRPMVRRGQHLLLERQNASDSPAPSSVRFDSGARAGHEQRPVLGWGSVRAAASGSAAEVLARRARPAAVGGLPARDVALPGTCRAVHRTDDRVLPAHRRAGGLDAGRQVSSERDGPTADERLRYLACARRT